MSYVVKVMVVDKKTGKGLSGHRVKNYGGSEVKTDSSGMATVTSNSSKITVYVNGSEVYSGSASSAPKPIIYEKS
ncbi:MAG: hypothetical protein PSN04_04260 [Methyloprofundus sp.]|nr:hypothetical protein [Methyloprofundus sp.]